MEKGYVLSDKVRIYYEDSKTLGETILFLHGNGEDSSYFNCVKDLFIKKYHTVFIDTRNHGESDIVEKDLNFNDISNDVIAVLKYLNIDKVNIIGFSDGASTALTIACNYNIAKSLVLVGANYRVDGMKDETINLIKAEQELLKIKRFFSKEKRNQYRLNKLMLTYPNFDEELLKNISVPTFNIVGDNDCIKLEHTKSLTSILKSKENIFGKATHDLIKEYPLDFYEVVDEFISNLES